VPSGTPLEQHWPRSFQPIASALSASGHKWTFNDVRLSLNDVRFTPETGHVQCKSLCPLRANSRHCRSFDYLVGAGEQIVRNYKAERFGRLEIDNGLELGRLHNRKVGGFLSLEDAAGVESDLPVRFG
jgi:hypothetical protein